MPAWPDRGRRSHADCGCCAPVTSGTLLHHRLDRYRALHHPQSLTFPPLGTVGPAGHDVSAIFVREQAGRPENRGFHGARTPWIRAFTELEPALKRPHGARTPWIQAFTALERIGSGVSWRSCCPGRTRTMMLTVPVCPKSGFSVPSRPAAVQLTGRGGGGHARPVTAACQDRSSTTARVPGNAPPA